MLPCTITPGLHLHLKRPQAGSGNEVDDPIGLGIKVHPAQNLAQFIARRFHPVDQFGVEVVLECPDAIGGLQLDDRGGRRGIKKADETGKVEVPLPGNQTGRFQGVLKTDINAPNVGFPHRRGPFVVPSRK